MSMLPTGEVVLSAAFKLDLAVCKSAVLFFSFCDSSFAEGGRRMHMAARPSRMAFGLETNPTITSICCTICSRFVSYGKKKKNQKTLAFNTFYVQYMCWNIFREKTCPMCVTIKGYLYNCPPPLNNTDVRENGIKRWC